MNPGMQTKGWNQIMTLPRKLTLISGNNIGIEPAGNIESLRYAHQRIDEMTLPANKEIVLKNVKGNAIEIVAEIEPGSASMIELKVLRSRKKEEYTKIALYPRRGYSDGRNYWPVPNQPQVRKSRPTLVSLETAHSSMLPGAQSRAPETAPVNIGTDETIKLRVFVDRSVVEVFVNGRQCVAARVYPGRDDSTGVSLLSLGKDSKLISLEAWQMKNIYE